MTSLENRPRVPPHGWAARTVNTSQLLSEALVGQVMGLLKALFSSYENDGDSPSLTEVLLPGLLMVQMYMKNNAFNFSSTYYVVRHCPDSLTYLRSNFG